MTDPDRESDEAEPEAKDMAEIEPEDSSAATQKLEKGDIEAILERHGIDREHIKHDADDADDADDAEGTDEEAAEDTSA